MFKIFQLMIFLFVSCSMKVIKPGQVKAPVSKVQKVPSKKENNFEEILRVKAQFVDFYLGDASHYTFKKESGELIVFDACKVKNIEFAQGLAEEESNEENQGWGSNKNLKGKWFLITYIKKRPQPYIDGSIFRPKVITKAVLLTD